MLRDGFVCLLLASVALGQSTSPSSSPKSKPTLKPRPSAPVSSAAPSETSSSVSPDTPVITIQGLCERPGGSTATPSDCKTVITRAEFEKITNAVQPNMPPAAKKQFVNRYVMVLLLSEKAHELGLDQGPEFDEQMYLARIQNLARLAGERLQKDASQVSDNDVDEYYRAHSADFKTISFERLYVPKQKQVDTSAQKPGDGVQKEVVTVPTPKLSDPDVQKKREESEAAMKEEADKLRARAAAGEDIAKLQQEAYDFADYKLKAPNPRMDKVRKASIPPADVSIFELKKGEVSQVFNDPAGLMVYKVEAVEELPVASVREEIARTLQTEKTKNTFDSLQNSAKTTLDESYFATPAPPTLRNPGEAPTAENPAPGKK
jgi:hypothetical protein